MAIILMIIFLSVCSSISVPTADKQEPPPNLTNENPSSCLPTQNNNPITPPIVTPPQDELTSVTSLPASQAELSLTSQPALPVQTLELHVPSFPVRASTPQQSYTTRLSAHATQGGQENSMTAPQPANEIQTDTAGPSGRQANPPSRFIPLYRRALQSPIQRNPFVMSPQSFHSPGHPFQPSFLPITVPWYQRNEGGQHQREYHRMDRLSKCVLHHFLAGGLSYTSSWTERPTLSTSIYIQCFLNQVAFSLFLLAHFVFHRTNPAIAFIIDRVSFSLIVISGYLSTMPMYRPYVAIIMLLVVVMVYIFSRFRG